MAINKKDREDRFGILAWPAVSNKNDNPYNYLLYKEIERAGYTVHEFDFNLRNILRSIFLVKFKVLHFHWPNYILSTFTQSQARRRLYTFFIYIKLLQFFNKKIVWTVHNLVSHESKFPTLDQKLNNFLYRHVNGFICMNKIGIGMVSNKIRNNQDQKISYIPHPHYKGFYSNGVNSIAARSKLGVDQNKFVFLFLGQIRRYKNVTGLIKAFKELNDDNTMLIIAGNLNKEVEREVKELLTDDENNIKLYDAFVEDSDLQIFLNAADLVVTPYNRIFNSGSIFLNLSFNRPTLAPDLDLFKELKQMIGTEWIKTYPGAISQEALQTAMDETTISQHHAEAPDLSFFMPEKLALDTIEFYRSFC